MAMIFFFSSMPEKEVARTVKPLIVQADKVTLTLRKPHRIQVEWLKVGHFVGYSCLGLSLLYAFAQSTRHPTVFAVLSALFYSITDEFHQSFVPGRSSHLSDIALDTSAAAVTIAVFLLLKLLFRYRHNKSLSKNIA